MKLLPINIIICCFIITNYTTEVLGANQQSSGYFTEYEFLQMLDKQPRGLARMALSQYHIFRAYGSDTTDLRKKSNWQRTPIQQLSGLTTVMQHGPSLLQEIRNSISRMTPAQMYNCTQTGHQLPEGSYSERSQALVDFHPTFFEFERDMVKHHIAYARAKADPSAMD